MELMDDLGERYDIADKFLPLKSFHCTHEILHLVEHITALVK